MAIFSIVQTRASANLFLRPNAVGCATELTPFGAVNNWECIDDPIGTPDYDTTYVYNSSPTLKYDLYSLPNHTTETGIINYVQIFARAKSYTYPQHLDGIYKIIVTDNACTNIYKSDDKNLTTGYGDYYELLTENPRTSTTWTWDDIDKLQIGLECNSPTLEDQIGNIILRPNGDGGQCGSRYLSVYSPGSPADNWETQFNDCDKYVYMAGSPFLIDTWYCDHYTMENHTALGTESINYILVRILAARWGAEPGHYGRTLIVTNGNNYYGDAIELVKTPTYITTQYTTNPFTSAAWTWTEIDALLCGSSLMMGSVGYHTYCCITEIIVNYNLIINPEIRTTQCYAKVNYVPPDVECTLNKPEDISVDHSMNVKMLNFWNGTREVYSLNRSGKSMVLTGSEYQSDICNKACPCERITCMKEMGKDGSTITISGLRSLFNGEFKIRSFGWKHISKKPESYEWILELEYDD